jgi:hypothetical protein
VEARFRLFASHKRYVRRRLLRNLERRELPERAVIVGDPNQSAQRHDLPLIDVFRLALAQRCGIDREIALSQVRENIGSDSRLGPALPKLPSSEGGWRLAYMSVERKVI